MFLIGKKEKTKKKQIKTKKIKFSTLGLILRGNISNDTRTGDIPTPQKNASNSRTLPVKKIELYVWFLN